MSPILPRDSVSRSLTSERPSRFFAPPPLGVVFRLATNPYTPAKAISVLGAAWPPVGHTVFRPLNLGFVDQWITFSL